MTRYHSLLENWNACEAARDWAKDHETFEAAWEACPRDSWLAWVVDALIERGFAQRGEVVRLTVDFLLTRGAAWGSDARATADLLREGLDGNADLARIASARPDALDLANAGRDRPFVLRQRSIANALATAILESPAASYSMATLNGADSMTFDSTAWVDALRDALRPIAFAGMARALEAAP